LNYVKKKRDIEFVKFTLGRATLMMWLCWSGNMHDEISFNNPKIPWWRSFHFFLYTFSSSIRLMSLSNHFYSIVLRSSTKRRYKLFNFPIHQDSMKIRKVSFTWKECLISFLVGMTWYSLYVISIIIGWIEQEMWK
jgi:hypothetical protein